MRQINGSSADRLKTHPGPMLATEQASCHVHNRCCHRMEIAAGTRVGSVGRAATAPGFIGLSPLQRGPVRVESGPALSGFHRATGLLVRGRSWADPRARCCIRATPVVGMGLSGSRSRRGCPGEWWPFSDPNPQRGLGRRFGRWDSVACRQFRQGSVCAESLARSSPAAPRAC